MLVVGLCGCVWFGVVWVCLIDVLGGFILLLLFGCLGCLGVALGGWLF